ncbi:MAG: heavy metal translocating P-type ATPase, partial [Bacilli bacterium]
MDSLIAVGTGAAFIYSIYNTILVLNGQHEMTANLYYESGAVIITLISLGKYLEAQSKGKTNMAIKKLIELSPKRTTILVDNQEVEIDIDDVAVGDIIVVKPGEKLSVDGEVVFGSSFIDEAMITGESIPVEKTIGDKVIGATINTSGSIRYRATKVGSDTTLSQIIKLVEDAQGQKAQIALLADKVSLYFVPTVIVLALISGLGWYFIGGESLSFSLTIFISVLVIACPCALGLATPTSIMVGTGKGASNGILIKGGQALEVTGQVNAVIFDKTGTITMGKPAVTDYITVNGEASSNLNFLKSAEKNSKHPLSLAILDYQKLENQVFDEIETYEELSGLGIKTSIKGKTVLIGNEALMENHGVVISDQITQIESLATQGKSVILMA